MKKQWGIFNIFDNLSLKLITNVLFYSLFCVVAVLGIIRFTKVSSAFYVAFDYITYIGLVIALIILILLFVFLKYMISSINRITAYAKVLSGGKLNVNDIKIQGNNDFSTLAKAINDMKSNIMFFIDNTKNNVIVLSDSIENLSSSMNVAYNGNEQLANKMEGISGRSQEQLALVKESVLKTNDVSKSIEFMSEHINDVKYLSDDTNSASNSGKEILNIYNENMNLISQSISDTKEFISKLKSSAREIGEVVKFIVGLSEQLKMLSLNASIEANRAGEAGKGFTVVANEIIKLSDFTKNGIDKINAIVRNIMNSSDDVEVSLKSNIENLQKGNYIFSNIKEVFNEINNKNKELLNQVHGIVDEISKINTNTKNNVFLCEKINHISEDVSQSTEDSVAVIEEELAEFQQINSSMSMLQSLLLKIENLTTKFELDIKPSQKIPKKTLKIVAVMPNFGDVWEIMRFGVLYACKILKLKNTDIRIISVNGFSEKDVFEAINQFNKILSDGCDGIIIPGFFEGNFKNVLKTNIPIITYNADFKGKDKRIAHVGQDSYKSGEVAAKLMAEHINGKGNLLVITADKPYENMEHRRNGFINGIKNHRNITIEDTLKISFDNDKAYETIKNYLERNQNISGIFNVAGGVSGLSRAIEDTDRRDIKSIVYDTTKEILQLVDKGLITSTIGQDPFRQGYDPIIYLYNYLVAGEKPNSKETRTKIEVIDKSNVKHFID